MTWYLILGTWRACDGGVGWEKEKAGRGDERLGGVEKLRVEPRDRCGVGMEDA